MGPRLRTGKKVSAPTMRTVETRSVEKSGVVTGKVPADSATDFFCARLPAIARIGTTAKKRPRSIATASELLYQFVFELMPLKAEPLLPAAEVPATTNRSSVPSRFPAAAAAGVAALRAGVGCVSAAYTANTPARKSAAIAPQTAQPWRAERVMRPSV